MQKLAFALAALTSSFFMSACESVSDPGGSGASVHADLRELAAKVPTFNSPAQRLTGGPDAGPELVAAKRAAAEDCWNGSVDGVTVFDQEPTAEDPTRYLDTTWHYTAAGTLACGEDEETAYIVTHSFAGDAETEYRMKARVDYGAPGGAYLLKLSATGKVHYAGGYDLEIKSFDITLGMDPSSAVFKLVLGLEDGKYTVDMGLADGVSFDEEIPAEAVAMSGTIRKGSETVGYFEILGDDRVVIRDEAKVLVAAP